MWVKFTQTNAGLPAAFCRLMKSTARSAVTSSMVSIRFLVRGPVSVHLLADLAETRIDRRVVLVRRLAVHHAARAELGKKCGVLRIVRQLRLFFGVQMIKVAKELVEAMDGGQKFVAVAQMILAELPGRIAKGFE